MKVVIALFLVAISLVGKGQIHNDFVDTNNPQIKKAAAFLTQYLSEFKGHKVPDYTQYWSSVDCQRYTTPDPIVFAISTDFPTYSFGAQKSIFYARATSNYVHFKTLLSQVDATKKVTVYAITNHYVGINNETGVLQFIRPFPVHHEKYRTVTKNNITYHFLKDHVFNGSKSDRLLEKIKAFEKKWGFDPIKFDYYFTNTQDELGAMRGLDYFYGMEQSTPSGMAFPKDKTIYCSGLGEDYFHEVLHLYLNPKYAAQPVNHGLIYYLAGGLGLEFDAHIEKMNRYLIHYPSTNLSDFETLVSKDITLHINHTVVGLICKIIDEKDGVAGLKRLLQYKDMTTLFNSEFGLEKTEWDAFLKKNFKKYR